MKIQGWESPPELLVLGMSQYPVPTELLAFSFVRVFYFVAQAGI